MNFTERIRLPLLEQGGLGRYWSSLGINKAISLVDDSLDSIVNLSDCFQRDDGAYVLSTQNGSFDTQRARSIRVDYSLSGSPIRIIVPKSEKVYNFAVSPAIGVKSSTNSIVIEQEETGSEVSLGFSDVAQFGVVTPSSPFFVFTVISTSTKLYKFGSKLKKKVINVDEPSTFLINAGMNNNVAYLNCTNSCDIELPPADDLPNGFEMEILFSKKDVTNFALGFIKAPSGVKLFESAGTYTTGLSTASFLRVRKDISTATPGVGMYQLMLYPPFT